MGLVGSSELTYSSIKSPYTNEDDDAMDELPDVADAIIDDDENNRICEKNMNADNYRLWIVRAAHDAILNEIDACLSKRRLTACEAPHLDTKALISKLNDVVKTVDLDVSMIMAEKVRDSVLGTIQSWLCSTI